MPRRRVPLPAAAAAWSPRGARPAGIDGPYAAIADTEGLALAAASVAAPGFDGKWVLYPSQVGPVNEASSPSQQDYDRAERDLAAYAHYTGEDQRGAAPLDGQMIDEASRKPWPWRPRPVAAPPGSPRPGASRRAAGPVPADCATRG